MPTDLVSTASLWVTSLIHFLCVFVLWLYVLSFVWKCSEGRGITLDRHEMKEKEEKYLEKSVFQNKYIAKNVTKM